MKMLKKISLLIVVVLVAAGSANAKIIRWGLKAGMNVNKIHFNKSAADDLSKPENSTGWEIGGMAEINVPLVGLCFDASVMYARMNNNANGVYDNGLADNPDVPGKNTIPYDGKEFGQNFIQIPINIKYRFSLPVAGNFIAPYVFTGPEFAFKLDKDVANAMFKSHTCQVAWNVGLGLQFVNHLQIGASYAFGMNNVANKVMGVNAQQIKAKNNYWTVTAAWLF